MGKTGKTYRSSVGKCLGKSRRWEGNIKLDFMEIGYEDGRGMALAQLCVLWQALVLVMPSL
jgi:hypothetical protein